MIVLFLLLIYVYQKDRHKEPLSFLFLLFVIGMISAGCSLFSSILCTPIIEFFQKNHLTFLNLLFFTGGFEEGWKWIFLYTICFKNKNYEESFDMIVYSVWISLGFAFLENIFYVWDHEWMVALLRNLFAIPAHACYGILMGYYLTLYRKNQKKKKYLFASLFLPIFLHGLYDYFLLAKPTYMLFVFLFFVCLLFSRCLYTLFHAQEENRRFEN